MRTLGIPMKSKGYIAIIIILSLLVGGGLIYTIWAIKGRTPPETVSVEKPVPKETEASRETEHTEALAKAKRLEEENNFLGAKRIYEDLLPVSSNPEQLQDEIYRLNMEILFSPLATEPPDGPESIVYTVKAGDSLEKIAREYKTTVDLIKESNRIDNPRKIQIHDRFKVVTDQFSIIVSRSKNTLTLLTGEMVMKEYTIGTGEYRKTPLGDFKIRDRIVEPPWKTIPYGDPRNVLGTRWMGLVNEGDTVRGYGIHGTWEPETIGKSVSQGCIRMNNEDVEEIFKIVPIGTPVKLIE